MFGKKVGENWLATRKMSGRNKIVFLRLMECLTPAFGFDLFMNSNYRSFGLLTDIGVNNI